MPEDRLFWLSQDSLAEQANLLFPGGPSQSSLPPCQLHHPVSLQSTRQGGPGAQLGWPLDA